MTGRPGPVARLASRLYGGATWLRNVTYDRGWRAQRKLPVPVISVGNLTVGGTGKTPMAGEIARLLSQEGWLVGIVSRGYGSTRLEDPMLVSDLWHVLRGASEAGDEPFLLARRLPGIPVVVGRNRYEAGRFALDRFPLHAIVLDDGFQHRRLHRDADLVLVDATDPWGNGCLLPAGRLRESKRSLARAHAILLTRLHQAPPDAVRRLVEELRAAHPQLPILGTRAEPLFLKDLFDGTRSAVSWLAGRRVVALAATAKPESFFFDLEALGATVVRRHAFRDHHPFTRDECWKVLQEARTMGAEAVVTTEKDAVRLPVPGRPPVRVLSMVQRLVPEDVGALARVLSARLPGPSRGGRQVP